MDESVDPGTRPLAVDWVDWRRTLEQFAAATGLYVAGFDAQGVRQAGPFHASRVAQLMSVAGVWADPAGPARALEGQLVSRVFASASIEHASVLDELWVQAAPLTLGGSVRGAIVYGWVFHRFSSSLSCERIARHLGLDGARLWAEARLEPPVPPARMAVYTELLRTLIASAARHVEAVERLEELSRLREVFLAGVSHELRTPLSVLGTRIEILLHGNLDDPAGIRAALTKMKQHVAVEAKLVEDLIEASRTRTGQLSVDRERASLGAILQAATTAVQPHADAKHVSVTAPLPDAVRDMFVFGDAHRLQQVFWNLLSNAVKFTPAAGRVEVGVADDGHVVEVTVSDTGKGIDPAMLPHVFETFTKQYQGNAQGFGLGLSIARHIVELHGGTIRAESPGVDRGATFRVLLPKMAAAQAAEA